MMKTKKNEKKKQISRDLFYIRHITLYIYAPRAHGIFTFAFHTFAKKIKKKSEFKLSLMVLVLCGFVSCDRDVITFLRLFFIFFVFAILGRFPHQRHQKYIT